MTADFLLYGSTGFVGDYVARQVSQNGLRPILAGRDENKLKAQSEALGLPYRAFNLENLPISGTLDGDLPNLIYTPAENFSGTDFFTFSVSLDDETSQPAQVTINVLASGDLTGPSVLWVIPEDQEMDVEYSGSPIRTKRGHVLERDRQRCADLQSALESQPASQPSTMAVSAAPASRSGMTRLR